MGKANIVERQKNVKLKQQMKSRSTAPKPKKKRVQIADKNVRKQISNGELVKVIMIKNNFFLLP